MRTRRRTIRNFLTLATLAAVGGATTVTHHLRSPAEAAVMQQVIDSGPVDILGGQSDANAKKFMHKCIDLVLAGIFSVPIFLATTSACAYAVILNF